MCLAGELCALAYAYDYAYLLSYDMAHIFRTWFPLILLTESMSLFNLLIHTSTVSTEKRLMINITTLRQAYERRDITDIGWLRSGGNVAYALMNPG